MNRIDLRRAVALAAAVAATVGGILPYATRADTVTLTNGGTQSYTPSQVQTANGVTQRLISGQAQDNSINVNYNTASAAPTIEPDLNSGTIALDATVAGLAGTTALENVGKLRITTAGAYQIFFDTDDGSRLFIDNTLIINNEGGHGNTPLSKVVNLDAGLHDVRAFVVNNGGGGGIQVSYLGIAGSDAPARVIIPTTALTQAENAAANAVSAAVSTTVRPNNATPVSNGTAPDSIVLGAGFTGTLDFIGNNYAIAGLADFNAGAGSTLNVTAPVAGDTRRAVRFNTTTFNGGLVTVTSALDFVPGVVGGTPPTTLRKAGPGRLILDNISATGNNFTGTTIDVQGGVLNVIGSSVAGATNPLGAAIVNLDGTTLALDSQFGSVTFNNVITLGATGGTIKALSGPATYTLSSTTAIAVPTGGTLTLNTFGGSNNQAGATLVLNAPLTGAGAWVKNVTPGSTAGTGGAGTITGTAAQRDNGIAILTADSSGFSGPVTLATSTAAGGTPTIPATVTVQPGILEGRPATAASKVFGTGGITLQGGQLNLRGNLGVASTLYTLDNPVTITGNTTIDTARLAAFDNSTFRFGTLAIGGQTLTVNTANGFQLAFNGATTFSGNPTFALNTNNPRVTIGTLSDAGTPRTITKSLGGELVVTGPATSFTGLINVTGGQLTGGGTGTAFGTAGIDVNAAGLVISGNLATFDPLTRTAAAPVAGSSTIRLAAGAIVAETELGANVSIGNLGTARDLVFGIAANLSESFTVGTVTGATPWRGVGVDGTARTLGGGTITAESNFIVTNRNNANLTIQGVTVATPNGPVVASSQMGTGRIVLGANAGFNSNLTFTVNAGAIQFNAAGALGTDANGNLNARAVFYPGTTADPGGAGSMSGNITLLNGSFLQLNDGANLGGTGTLSGEPGAVVQIQNATALSNTSATQTLASLPAGVLYRLENDLGATLPTQTNPAGNFQVHGANRTNTISINAGTPPRGGFVSGLLTNDNAARTLSGTVGFGANGGTIAASTGGAFTVAAAVTAGPALTIGTTRVVDVATNGDIRSGTVLLTGTNNYAALTQLNLVGRSTLQGTPTGAGNLPQGAGVALSAGGIYQINSTTAAATDVVNLGAVTGQGGVFILNRSTSTSLTLNLNGPLGRGGSAFAPGNRGSITFQSTNPNNIGSATDQVRFANAADAPADVVVTPVAGGSATLDMSPPWIISARAIAPGGTAIPVVSSFLNYDAAGNGFVPVTYTATAIPATPGVGTEIVDATATQTVTGDVSVGALRTSASINNAGTGTNVLRVTSGGFLTHNLTAAITHGVNLNFGSVEGIISNASNQVVTYTGVMTAPSGVTKMGFNSVVFNNTGNQITGGITIAEANLRPGANDGLGTVSVLNILSAGVLDLNNFNQSVRGLQGSGVVNNAPTDGTRTLTINTVNAGDVFDFTGTIRNSTGARIVALTKTGSGSQILSGTLGYTGATAVNGGLLRVDGLSTAVSAYSVASGATLGGSGIITGAVTVASGGNLAPGTSPGQLRTGNLTISSGGNYLAELNGITAGSGYDQTDVVGTVTLTGANLVASLGGGYSPSTGDKLFIINNDGIDPVTGTFAGVNGVAGAAEGATVTIGGLPFTITYTAEFYGNTGPGIGNDVALIAQIPEPASLGLLGLGAAGLLARRRRRVG